MVQKAENAQESEKQVANAMNHCFLLNMLEQLGLAPRETRRENEKVLCHAIQERELSEEEI